MLIRHLQRHCARTRSDNNYACQWNTQVLNMLKCSTE